MAKTKTDALKSPDRDRYNTILRSACIVSLSDLEDIGIQFLKTGFGQLDYEFGGWPCGCMSQVAGPPGAGKTTITLQTGISALGFLDKKYKLGFADFECRINIPMVKKFCDDFGIDYSRVDIIQPDTGQNGIQAVIDWVESDDTKIIIVDSLKAIVDEGNIEKDVDQNKNARGGPKLIHEMLEAILAKVYHLDKCVLLIDHLKPKNVGNFTIMDTASGVDVKFYTSLRLNITPGKEIKRTVNGKAIKIGKYVKFKSTKSTVCPQIEITDIAFKDGLGISLHQWYIKKAYEYGLIYEEKNKYYIKGVEKAIGKKMAIMNFIIKNPKIWDKLYKVVREAEDKRMAKDKADRPELYDWEFEPKTTKKKGKK